MRTIFFEKFQDLSGRIIIELHNAANDYVELNHGGVKDLKLSINRVYDRTVVDTLNSEQRIHVQILFPMLHELGSTMHHFMFTIKHANDFSCMNIYFRKLLENPLIDELAEKWITSNYDHELGDLYAGDLKSAFSAGYNAKK